MSIGRIARQGANYVGRLILDDKFSSRFTAGINMYRKQKKAGKYTGNLGNIIKDSFVRAGKKTNPNIIKAFKNSISSFGTETAALWKSGKGIFSKLRGTLKGLGKRLPIIGAILTVGFELPNIVKATKDGGLIKGLAEAGKSTVRLVAAIGLAAVASAFLGPVVGVLAGGYIGDRIGKLIVGKSYSEKQAEKEEQLAQAQEEQQQAAGGACAGGSCSSGRCGGAQPAFAGNTPQVQPQQQQQPGATNPFYPYQMPPIAPYDDIMFNATFQQPQRLNYQA